MDFGAHDLEKSKRFSLQQQRLHTAGSLSARNGDRGAGMCRQGVSHDYQYFAYKGSVDLDDYRLDGGALVAEPQLVNHLATRQRWCLSTRVPNDFSAMPCMVVVASGPPASPISPSFIWSINRMLLPYRQVLTRTLRLDRLTSADVKNYLLEIFKRDLSDAAIDFQQRGKGI